MPQAGHSARTADGVTANQKGAPYDVMGAFNEAEDMFNGVRYNVFTSTQIREKMEAKVRAVRGKIEERQGRITKIIADNGISPEALSDLVIQYNQDQKRGNAKMSYSVSHNPGRSAGDRTPETLIPAGVIANLVTEKELVASETAEAKRMDLILRNLRDETPWVNERTGECYMRKAIHTLTDQDMEYLGF